VSTDSALSWAPDRKARASGHLSALTLALIGEAVLVMLLIVLNQLGWWDRQPVLKEVMKLDLTTPPTEPKPPEPPKPPKKTPPPPRKVALPDPPTVIPPPPVEHPLVPPPPEPTPFVEKVTPPPPAPDPNQAMAQLADYTAKIRAAVQAALVYPKAAEEMGFSGRVRMEFKLRDRQPSGARVVISSRVGMFDRAAMQAVLAAAYPEPPDSLRGQSRLFQVWVEFSH
jgi:protein TonB